MAAPASPLFARSIAPGVRLAIWTAISVLLIVLDSRYHALPEVRDALATLLRPIQTVVRLPVDLTAEVGGFLVRHHDMQQENARLKTQHVEDAAGLQRLADLESQNAQLRRLLDARQHIRLKTVAAEIWSVSRDPFSRRVVLDKGASQGIEAGQPVVDDLGLMGQVLHAYAYSSDAVLVTDSDQVVPAYVQRTGQRVLVFGTGYGLEIRYQPSSTDIRQGDVLLTSGIDHVYQEGLPVARVSLVLRPGSSAYAKIYCRPVANVEGSRMVIVITGRTEGTSKR
jgi:rod shape-determining protein MreC